jgi:hypothetical protein
MARDQEAGYDRRFQAVQYRDRQQRIRAADRYCDIAVPGVSIIKLMPSRVAGSRGWSHQRQAIFNLSLQFLEHLLKTYSRCIAAHYQSGRTRGTKSWRLEAEVPLRRQVSFDAQHGPVYHDDMGCALYSF